MHQTISGVTLKSKVKISTVSTKDFLERQKLLYNKLNELIFYYDDNLFINDAGINYFQQNYFINLFPLTYLQIINSFMV